jgi:hypothetical protein
MQDYNFYQNTNTAGADYLSKSFAGNMVRYAPNGMAPLFALTSMLGEGQAKSVEHGYFSKTMLFPKVQINNGGGYNASATTFVVDDSSEVVPGELLITTAGEVIRVMSVPSPTSINVLRQVGQVSAAAVSDNEVLYSIGNAFEQASLRPISRLMNPVRVMNNTQIFRDSWALPATMTAIAPIVGDSLVAESRQDCGLFHASAIERSLIFGQKSGQVVNGQYLTTMDGIIETVRRLAPPANTSTASSTTTYSQLETMLNPVFDTITDARNGNERVIFVGGTARTVINNIGRLSGQYQIVDGQTNFGLQFQTFKTSRGMFRMIEHPIFNTNARWKGLAIAVDLPAIRIMNLRKTQHVGYGMDGKATDSGIDAVGGTLTTELTVENTNPSAHAVIWGLTAAAAES